MRKYIFYFFCLILFMSSSAHAFYPYGTVPQGMGGAYCALGDDIAAIYYNPASLNPPFLVEGGISAGFWSDQLTPKGLRVVGDLLGGDWEELDPEDFQLGPQDFTLTGLAGAHFNIPVANLYPGVALISDNLFEMDSDALQYTSRNTLFLNARYSILSPPFDLMSITVGGNLKLLHGERRRYLVFDEEGLEFFEEDLEDSGDGYALDLGLLVKTTNLLTVGFSVRDLTHSFSWEEENTDEEKSLPVFRAGASTRVPLLAITVAGDIEHFAYEDERLNRLHLGAQKGFFFNTLILRAGGYTKPERDDVSMVFTAGLGLNFRMVKADLSLLYEGERNRIKGGSLSAGVRF